MPIFPLVMEWYFRLFFLLLVVGTEVLGQDAAFADNKQADYFSTPFLIYPNSETSYNPRVPCVPPADDINWGKRMDIETTFIYSLSPGLSFVKGGNLDVELRDTWGRQEKELIALSSGADLLSLKVSPALEGRIPALVLSKNGQEVKRTKLPHPLTSHWTHLTIQWDASQAICSMNGKEMGRLDLPASFAPTNLQLQVFSVTALHLEGEGRLDLDWKQGYGAVETPQPEVTDVSARILGFDTMVISQNATNRDYPMVQVLNSSPVEHDVSFALDLQSEMHQLQKHWTQAVKIGARSAILVPIQLPAPLPTDIYHLAIKSEGLASELSLNKHFMYVQRRDEAAGPPKFGLHADGRDVLGVWPDALPIRYAHWYLDWGIVVGPPWLKDFKGNFGLDPHTPPDQWDWDPRLDWDIAQGLEPYACIQSTPFIDWQRERLIPEFADQERHMNWGIIGGFPKLSLYRLYVHALAERYKGKVKNYEIENEPNSRMSPEDYAKILPVAYEAIHAVDRSAKVFGICGTAQFIPWMKKVFDLGGWKFMDGVSQHTYTAPNLPDQANLAGLLTEERKLIAATGKPMQTFNSETGTYVALREEVDHPIPSQRLADLIKQGTPGLACQEGWPNYALEEKIGAISVVQNVIYNFLAGAKCFTFFDWSPLMPPLDWWTKPGQEACFSVFSATKDGVRTPGLYALGAGVLTAEMEGALPASGVPIDQGGLHNGIQGGVFAKQNGGQVAILWSSMGKRSVILQAADPDLEVVSIFGDTKELTASPKDGKSLYSLELTEEPIYIHVKHPGIELAPSPVINLQQESQIGEVIHLSFTLINRYKQPWSGTIGLPDEVGWTFQPSSLPFALKPGERTTFEFACTAPSGTKHEAHAAEASMQLPDGSAFSFPIGVTVRPMTTVVRLPDHISLEKVLSGDASGETLRLDQPEQVVQGRPPEMSSLQEEQYWKGPTELSGEVSLGYNDEGLFVLIKAHDAHLRLPEHWPDVRGSCVELFFDFRSTDDGRGLPNYDKNVYQVILKPSLAVGKPVEIWNASSKYGVLANTLALGCPDGPDGYRIAFQIPWTAIGQSPIAGWAFGFDAGLNGPPAQGPGRKSQIMLYGTASNSISAAGFGTATLGSPKEIAPTSTGAN